jgi:hypothetical protein
VIEAAAQGWGGARIARWLRPQTRIGDVAILVAVAVVVRLAFWLITDRVWEDALITVTHARNAVAGLGLTHHPGEPVTHGFTSAVSVLIPLAGEVVVHGSGIFVLKVASLVAAALTIVVAARLCARLGLGRWPTVLALLYLAVDQNQIFYGMAGMETQVAVLVLLWSVDALMSAGPKRIGLTFGLAVLTRPDFLLWDGLASLDLLARIRWRAVQAFLVAGLILAPWIIFTTLYYGSPIPNTILAKSAHFVTPPPIGLDPLGLAGWFVTSFADRGLALLRTFTPFYEDTLVVSAPLPLGLAFFVSIIVWVLAIVGATRTWRIPGWRAAVLFAGAFTVYRLVLLPGAYFDWYVPPHTAILILLVAAGIDRLRPLPTFDPRPVVAVVVAVLLAAHLPFTTGLEAKLQQNIENDVRRQVGLELGRLMKPGETVATESAGYYEFYSNAKMYDYPGLTSPTARTTIASLPSDRRGIEDMIDALRPDWLALRPPEWDAVRFRYPDTANGYSVVETVSSPPGSIEFDPEGRPRIDFLGYRKDASSWQILIVHRREAVVATGAERILVVDR